MEINQLAELFLNVRTCRDNEKRVIEYDLAHELNELKNHFDPLTRNLSMLSKQSQIEQAKYFLQNREAELAEISSELLDKMKSLGIKPAERFPVHVQNQTYFDVWYLTDDEVCTAGNYTKIS
jgi:hypothetical protein